MRGLLRSLANDVLGLLFPERCGGCGKTGDLFCAACRTRLRPYNNNQATPDEGAKLAIPHIDRVFVAFVFEATLREAVHTFKYHPLRRMAIPLGDLLAERVPPGALLTDALIAVPLHTRRLAERGFNQSEMLAQRVARAHSLPLLTSGLVRTRDTVHQVRLDARARQENMQAAFRWQSPTPPPARVALVDDILTTGATLSACAGALRAAGTREVIALALARSRPE
jgi:ComF family protein